MPDPLDFAQAPTAHWFRSSFEAATPVQQKGWPSLVAGQSTLMLAPTGSGKTLAAFLVAIDRLMFRPAPTDEKVRVLYISPLKALGVDVERNLRAPLAGIRAVAERGGVEHCVPRVAVRSGDTPTLERTRMQRHPPDILITTPESLYLLLTSKARAMLTEVETVIVDEIHSMVPTKRGVHLFLSLERLEALRARAHEARGSGGELAPLQRVGLSATQRPLDEVARLLGGSAASLDADATASARPVTIVEASHHKQFDIRVEVPVEDMTQLPELPAEAGSKPRRGSIWPSIHPRLVELVRAHRSTMIFVNSRRLAERLAGALNELADEEIALAHHGSIAKDKRADIEDRLKRGVLPAIVATSSLELGIDMGAVDLVIQLEAPPSVASGIQRIGRAGHHVGAVSRGVIVPKYRGDLLACAAVTKEMLGGRVEETYYPRNALDVLAQHIVAMVLEAPIAVDEVYRIVRSAAPFSELPRRSFEGVLDMLSGRYPSDHFAQLRPRITWDRIAGELSARKGARMLAVTNGGTIPDRGLYGVFLAGDAPGDTAKTSKGRAVRVGELDEEMVFESQAGDVFLLGASSWRIEEITHDRVLVSPAPGEPGRMPFWRGDRPGRPLPLGRAIGALTRELARAPIERARAMLADEHLLDERAANNVIAYVAEQVEATGRVPSDRTIVLERFMDEVGDWCVAVLTPFGGRVHAPWSMAIQARIGDELDLEVDTMWSDDGILFRLPETDEPPDDAWFLPASADVEALVTKRLSKTSLFAAHFRENAARALLLPRRRPGQRTPLWVQRRKSADLLAVASRFPDFPIVLETYRECLRDVLDMPGLVSVLEDIESRRIRIASVASKKPSPFAGALLFTYIGNFLYEGDAPLAERRAQALSLDHAQLRELLGEPELRELFDPEAIEETELRLQRLRSDYPLAHADGLHDLLLSLGDLSLDELRQRSQRQEADEHRTDEHRTDEHSAEPASEPGPVESWLAELLAARRVVEVSVASEPRFVAVEDVGRYRDALGIVAPPGLPLALLEPVADALGDIVARYARTHGPFRVDAVAGRFGLGVAPIRIALEGLCADERVVEGEFVPGGRGREFCDANVLRLLKRRSLAKLRKQVEPVGADALGRFLPLWQGVGQRRSGIDAVADVVEQLQGAALPASDLEATVLPARVLSFDRRDLDELCASGEVLWRGVASLPPRDGRVALYLAEHYALLAPPPTPAEGELAAELRAHFEARGALFFRDLVDSTGRLAAEVLDAVWDMVWAGELTNDTLAPLRSLRSAGKRRGMERRSSRRRVGRALRGGPPGSEGRWSLLPRLDTGVTGTDRLAALSTQLLERHGVLTREVARAELVPGGFAAIYPVLKAMEEAGRIRRGYFVEGLGGAQFAQPGAEDRLRRHRGETDGDSTSELVVLAATDPANAYGVALPWPSREGARPARTAGARVVLFEGELVGYVSRSGAHVLSFLPDDEPRRSHAARALVSAIADGIGDPRAGITVTQVDGESTASSHLAPFFADAGFKSTHKGLFFRRGGRRPA